MFSITSSLTWLWVLAQSFRSPPKRALRKDEKWVVERTEWGRNSEFEGGACETHGVLSSSISIQFGWKRGSHEKFEAWASHPFRGHHRFPSGIVFFVCIYNFRKNRQEFCWFCKHMTWSVFVDIADKVQQNLLQEHKQKSLNFGGYHYFLVLWEYTVAFACIIAHRSWIEFWRVLDPRMKSSMIFF